MMNGLLIHRLRQGSRRLLALPATIIVASDLAFAMDDPIVNHPLRESGTSIGTSGWRSPPLQPEDRPTFSRMLSATLKIQLACLGWKGLDEWRDARVDWDRTGAVRPDERFEKGSTVLSDSLTSYLPDFSA